MKTSSLTIKHSPSAAALWLHAASVLSYRFMVTQLVKSGPAIGFEDRMVEVRG